MSVSFNAPDVLEGSDPENDDFEHEGGSTFHGLLSRIRTPGANVQSQIAKMKEMIPSDDEGEMSPVGSPRGDPADFGGREKFLQLRKKLQNDQLNRPRIVASEFDNTGEETWENVINVEALMRSIQDEQGGNDNSLQSLSLSESHPKFVEMHNQIKEKDIKLLDLESRLNELDRQNIDLQDTLSQRDKMLSSKNEAVQVIQEKFTKEISEKDVELKKTQKTLFDMEKVLASVQTQWKTDKEQLNSELQRNLKRLASVEDTNKLLEDTNKQLEAKNYDFSKLESENESLRQSIQEKTEELNAKNSEVEKLSEELETTKAQTQKFKSQCQTKLKTLKAKNKELTEKNAGVSEMENRITELEEEKGNLLLQLVDFDEQQALHSGMKNQIAELESTAKANADLIASLTAQVSTLQEENSDFSSSLDRSQEEVQRLSAKLVQLEKSSEESRVTLEMRAVELEEERDTMMQKSILLEEEIEQQKLRSTTAVGTDTVDLDPTVTPPFEPEPTSYPKVVESSNHFVPDQSVTASPAPTSTLFASPQDEVAQNWSDWATQEPPPPPPASTAFQYVNLDEDSAPDLMPVVQEPQHGDQWGGWLGFDDNSTFVQVKSPFESQAEPTPATSEAELTVLTTLCENLKAELARKTNECSGLEAQVNELYARSQTQEGNLEDLKRVQMELEKAKDNLRAKEMDLEATSGTISEIRSQLDDKLSQIANSLDVIESFKAGLTEKDGVISKLSAELANTQLVAQEKSSEATELMGRLDENSRVISGLRNEIKICESKYEELLNRLEDREITEMSTANLSHQVAELKKDLNARDEEVEYLRSQLKAAEGLLDGNETELEELRSRENDMIGGYQKLSAEFDALQEKLEEVKGQNLPPLPEDEKVQLKAVIAEKEEQLKALQKHLEEVQVQNLNLPSSSSSGNENVEFRALIAEKDEQLNSLKTKLAKVEEKLKKAMIMLKQKNLQIVELRKVSTSSASFNAEDNTGSGPQSLSPLPSANIDGQKEVVEKLQTELAEKDRKLIEVQTIVNDQQRQFEELKSNLHKAEAEIEHFRNDLTFNVSLAETLTRDLNAAHNHIHELNTQLHLNANQSDAHAQLANAYQELNTQSSELQESLQTKIEHIANLEFRLEEAVAHTQNLIQLVEKERCDNNNSTSELNSEVQRLQSELSTAESQRADWEEVASLEKENILKKLLALEKERDSYLEQVNSLDTLRSEISTQDQEILDAQRKLEWSAQEITNLSHQLQIHVQKTEMAESRAQSLEEERDALKGNLERSTQEITNLSHQLQIHVQKTEMSESRAQSLEEERDALKGNLEQLNSESKAREDLVAELKTREELIDKLNQSLTENESIIHNLQSQLKQSDESTARLNEELQKSREDALCLQHDREKSSNDWQTKITDLMSQLTTNDTELSLLYMQCREANALINELRTQYEEVQASLSSKTEHISRLEETNTGQASSLQEKSTEIVELCQKVQNLQISLDETILELQLLKQEQAIAQKVETTSPSKEATPSVNFFQGETTSDAVAFEPAFFTQNIPLQQAGFGLTTAPMSESASANMFEVDLEMDNQNQQGYISEMEDRLRVLQNELNHAAERLQGADELRAQYETLSMEYEVIVNENSALKEEIKQLKSAAAAATPKSSPKAVAVENFLNWEEESQTGAGAKPGGDWWSTLGEPEQVEVVEEPIVKKKSFETNQSTEVNPDVEALQKSLQSELESKDSRIYGLEVQVAELEINVQEANSTLTGINSELETATFEINRIRAENHQLIQEVDSLRRAKAEAAIQSETRSHPTPTAEASVDEEEKVKLLAELKESKLKNGKYVQRLKQLTKELEGLKSKKQFSLDGAFEEEFMKQMKEKDDLLLENGKKIEELGTEQERLLEKIDILERANERILEMNESQGATCQQLQNQKKQLEQEISGLKWRLEEVENLSGGEHQQISGESSVQPQMQAQAQDQLLAAAQEIQFLQQENYRLNYALQVQAHQMQTQGNANIPVVPLQEAPLEGVGSSQPAESDVYMDIESLRKQLETEKSDRLILERKIELLQGKILEIEQSEIKCFEEALMLKSWTRQLEMDNLKYQKEMEQIYNSVSDGDTSNLKVKTLQNEVMRLVETLHERDRRCEELTIEITRMLEERDGLQLKLSNVLQHNVSLHEEVHKGEESQTEIPSFDKETLKMKLAELESVNFEIKLDLRREKEARRLVQEQLLFSQSSRVYRDLTSRNKITFSSPSTSPRIRSASPPQSPSYPQDPPSPGPQSPTSPSPVAPTSSPAQMQI